jgi:hypothetical protein
MCAYIYRGECSYMYKYICLYCVFFKKLTLCFVFFITYAAPLLLSGVGGLPRSKKKDSLLAKKASSRVANILFDHMIISCVALYRCSILRMLSTRVNV